MTPPLFSVGSVEEHTIKNIDACSETKVKSSQIKFFIYTCFITPKRVKSLRGYLSVIALGQHSSFRRNFAAVGEPLATLRPIWSA